MLLSRPTHRYLNNLLDLLEEGAATINIHTAIYDLLAANKLNTRQMQLILGPKYTEIMSTITQPIKQRASAPCPLPTHTPITQLNSLNYSDLQRNTK